MVTISLCMIVKNEEAVLARCLDTVCDLVDEIIIVDTGSTDGTKQIAANYTDKIYDYKWINDFADARNFSFSKATMEYIYAPDADELLDEENRERFRQLKECLLPEIELVQMKYITERSDDAVMNVKKEYRPKLFKRLRTFTWIDPIHETVRLDPVVYDSEVEIIHRPVGTHEKRDFAIFIEEIKRRGRLSPKLRTMYARELLKRGEITDLEAAESYFLALWEENPVDDAGKEAACILARLARMQGNATRLMKYALRDMLETPCAEICCELGLHFCEEADYDEAVVWFVNAAYETQSILDVHTSGNLPLEKLVYCYEQLIHIQEDKEASCSDNTAANDLLREYKRQLGQYQKALDAWELPETL